MKRMDSESLRMGVGMLAMGSLGVLFIAAEVPWNTPSAATAVYSVLAFLCITMTVCSASRMRIDRSPHHGVFAAGTAHAAIVLGGASIFYLYNHEGPALHATTPGIALNLVALATTGLIMMLHARLQSSPQRNESVWMTRRALGTLIAVPTALFVVAMAFFRQPFPPWLFLSVGYLVGGVAVFAYLAAAIIMYRQYRTTASSESIRLSVSFVLLAGAAASHMSIMHSPSFLWLAMVTLMAISFVIAIVAKGYTFLVDVGVERNSAYLISVSISALVVLPFLTSVLLQALVPVYSHVDVGAAAAIHLAGVVLTGSLAYATFVRSRTLSSQNLSIVIMMLLTWSVSELAMALIYAGSMLGGPSESLMPYVTGALTLVLFLSLAVRIVLRPQVTRARHSGLFYLAVMAGYALLVVVAEAFQRVIGSSLGDDQIRRLDASVLLGLSYVGLFILLSLILLLAGKWGGTVTFDAAATGAVAIWLVMMIAKASFSPYTIGWWAGEVLLASSSAILPFTMVRSQIRHSWNDEALQRSQAAQIALVAEMALAHHRATLDTLEDLIQCRNPTDETLASLSASMNEVSHAHDLVRVIDAIVSGHRFSPEVLEPLDFVGCITEGVAKQRGGGTVEYKVDRKTGECVVMANSFLSEAVQLFVSGVVTRIGPAKSIGVNMVSSSVDGRPTWKATITLRLDSPDAESKRTLLERYASPGSTGAIELGLAQKLVEMIGGRTQMGIESTSTEALRVVFHIELPAATPSSAM
ncbi:MAG: hypothetical protein HXY34_06570 [Candidatus Thorarchaeota archaeon]|nr:hypothetical protein [Candidatus Thorarchaeota archaeon]